MHTDPTGQYRSLLLSNPNIVKFPDRLDNPWGDVADIEAFNKPAYDRIKRELERLAQHAPGQPEQSQGMLILGESGTGKTHLLMRLVKNLSRESYILFVPKPNNPHAMYLHIWTSMLASLSRKLPTRNNRSQLDDLLAHVFRRVLVPRFQSSGVKQQAVWAKQLDKDPFNLFTMIGQGERRQANLEAIRNITLRFLQENHPEVNQHVATALITYCLSNEPGRQRALLTWLSGQQVVSNINLGLPEWTNATAESVQADITGQKEQMALDAIKSLATLSGYYQPLILAFDQLEGLKHSPDLLTLSWAGAVREILTEARNLLVLTCVYPSLWKSWFLPRLQPVDVSAIDRIAGHQVTLQVFGATEGRALLALNLQQAHQEYMLPTEIYPFEESDVAGFCPDGTTARRFINSVRQRFNDWLDQDDSDAPGSVPTIVELSMEQVLTDALEKARLVAIDAYPASIPIEEDLVGRINNLVRALVFDCKVTFDEATRGKRVMPANFIVKAATQGLGFAVLNRNGKEATARLENLLYVAKETQQFRHMILIRDRRCPLTGEGARQHLASLKEQGCIFIHVDQDELCRINALYDTLNTVEDDALTVGNRVIKREEFIRFLRNNGFPLQSELFRRAHAVLPLFQNLMRQQHSPGAPFSGSDS